ncbi:MAG: LrgB family protein [Ruminococcaceae bacterium]|nr:LrgB family protein [Oscillospiraceae bacterium]
MTEFLESSVFFGVVLTLAGYGVGALLKKKLRLAIFNPILIGALLCIGVLLLTGVDYETYRSGAQYISYLLTPATVCLAIPLYRQLNLLKRYPLAILLGITAGVLISLSTILALSALMGLDHASYVTLLPKSITTAIGIGVSEELGGYVSLTAVVIIITGVLGNILAGGVCKLFRITEPVARGVAIGTASHAIGTSKAMEMGQVEGAMSGLSIVVSGLLTVVGASVFAQFL